MSFRLYVMRHGDALMKAPSDSLRPLSERGHKQSFEAAEYLKEQIGAHLAIGAVLVSPYLRAQETANNVIKHLDYTGSVITCDKITPNDSPDNVINVVAGFEPSKVVLMVSHQPLVSALIGRLASGNYYDSVAMGTASITCVDMPVVGIGQADIVWTRHCSI